MKRFSLFLIIITICAGIAAAEDVYVLRAKTGSSEGADLWARNMPLSAEALSLYAPLGFTASGKAVNYNRSADLSYSVRDLGVAAETANGEILHFSVTFSGKPKLPTPSRVITLKILVSELKKDSVRTESPGFLALNKAILQSNYKTGSAWIQSTEYDGKNTFTVKVALKK